MPPTTGKTLRSSEELMNSLHDIVTNNPHWTVETALMKLMYSYAIDPKALGALSEQVKKSFSKLSYFEIVPFFNIPAVKPFESVPLYRSRLPLSIVRRTCEVLEYATFEYGPLRMHTNEETRSRYLATLFKVILSIFQGSIINRPEELLEGEVTGGGKIEHVFYAFLRTIILFFSVKRSLAIAHPDKAIAQVIAECGACDLANASKGLWCPILGVLSDGVSVQLFVYDSSSRTVLASHPAEALSEYKVGLGFLKSVRHCMHTFIAHVPWG